MRLTRIWMIRENTENFLDSKIFVRATPREIEQREIVDGKRRFLAGIYDDNSPKYPRGAQIEGITILSLRQFDKWLKEH